jgi:hypothetical protein
MVDYQCILCGEKYVAGWKDELIDHLVKSRKHTKKQLAIEVYKLSCHGFHDPWYMPENEEGWK